MRLSLMLALLTLGCAPAASAQTEVPVEPFRSVTLGDGGHVVIRHGAEQRVTLVEGDADIRVEGTRLRIGKCRNCPRRSRPSIEIVTPVLDAVAVNDGGRLTLEGDFPRQAQLAAAVSNGGAIDARPLGADRVTASVGQGGMIFARPMQRLDAAVSQGGAITYWGDPVVHSAVDHGGVVQRGRAADAGRPLVDMMPHPPAPLPVPPVPPVGR